jgi:acyl-CoA dehydrogenase
VASEVFNCSAPDTGNMETIARYGSEENKARWLKPLLDGEFRSAFAMTEPEVASSDATNIQTRIEREGDDYVINGRKWWISGAGDPRCAIYITMGKTDPEAPRHSQQSMVIVPANTPGHHVVRPLNVMGYDDAPHGIWNCCLKTCASRSATSCSAKAAASRSPKAASDPAAFTTACA